MKAISIFSILGLLTISSSAWGATGICDFSSDRKIVNENQNNVIQFNNATTPKDKIYFCTINKSPAPYTLSNTDITRVIERSRSEATGNGRATASLNTTSVDVNGTLNTGDSKTLSKQYINRKHLFQFVTYHYYTQGELATISNGQPVSDTVCKNDGRWEHILNYLQSNPQIFVANGVQMSNAGGSISLAELDRRLQTADLATAKVPININDPSVGEVTATFQYTTGKGYNYGDVKQGNHLNVYCMVKVFPKIDIKFDELNKAGNFNIKYEIRKP